MPGTPTNAQREQRAYDVFVANTSSSSVAGLIPTISVAGNYVTVSVDASIRTNFLGIMNMTDIDVGVSTKTEKYELTSSSTVGGKSICLLALDPQSDDGIHIQGDNQVRYLNCVGYTNSTKSTAINANGSNATAVGEQHCAVGGYTATHPTISYSPAPKTGCTPVADPFATVSAYATTGTYTTTFPTPTIPSTCRANGLSLRKGTFTLQPGRYCGGLDIKAQATVTLEEGIYIIDDGIFNVQSGANVSGSNVLFYLRGTNARAQVIGGGTISLVGRSTGTDHAGFIMIAHPNANPMGESNIQGGGTFNMEGMIYMPKQRIEVSGNGDVNGTSKYFAIVAKDFYFRGNGTFNFKVHEGNGSSLPNKNPVTPTDIKISGRIIQ